MTSAPVSFLNADLGDAVDRATPHIEAMTDALAQDVEWLLVIAKQGEMSRPMVIKSNLRSDYARGLIESLERATRPR